MPEVTQILKAIDQGDPKAAEELLPLVYEELRRLAANHLAREPSGQTLQATALVHEAYIRLVDQPESREWDSRGHFFAAAADSMRRILVDNARRKQAQKRGGDRQRVDTDLMELSVHAADDDVLALDEALKGFAAVDARAARLVELRYFAGLTLEEAAQTLRISPATAKRDWAYARAWLNDRLSGA
jgi:RNA polymerase sigma factor (TIGR02999 family)